MSRIVILNSFDYWEQDHLWIAESAFNAIKKINSAVDHVHLPFKNDPLLYFQQVLAFRSIDFSSADMVVTFGPLAHTIDHRKKICFVTQHLKGYYELWNSPYGEIQTDTTTQTRGKLHYLDSMTLAEAKKLFCFYPKLQHRFPEIKMNIVSLPMIPSLPISGMPPNSQKLVGSFGTFDSDFRFDIAIKSLEFCSAQGIKLVIAAKLKRKEILESLRRIGRRFIENGTLELISDPTSAVENQLAARCDLLLDSGIEQDTFSQSTKLAIAHRKPVIGYSDSGLLETTNLKFKEFSSLLATPTAVSDFISKYFGEDFDKMKRQFSEQYSRYESKKGIDWEKELS